MGINPSKTGPPTGTSRRAFLTASAASAAALTIPLAVGATPAGATARITFAGTGPVPGIPTVPQRPDDELKTILREVDRANIEAIVRRLAGFGTRHTLSSQTDPVRGIGAARDWIFETLQGYAAASGGRMTVEKQSFVQPAGSPRIPVDTVITNVIATLRGDTAPGRVYVVSGHYDSRITDVLNATGDAPGADDDASGVAVAMELARVMASRHSEATLVFAAVAGEEQNLYGSDFMAAQMKATNVDVQGMITNDIVGSSTAEDGTRDTRTVRLFAEGVPTSETDAQRAARVANGGENDSPTRQLARFIVDVADNGDTGMDIRLIWRRDRFLRGGDQISFVSRGYPAVRFTEPAEVFAHQHQDVRIENGVQFGDLPEFCDFEYIAGVARVNGAALWSLAQGPRAPVNARIIAAQLTNDTTLRWDRGTEADLAGYEVLWRDTTAADWTHAIDVGDVTSATIDLSKDNVFFAVRAIDTAGHRSPVAFPRAANA